MEMLNASQADRKIDNVLFLFSAVQNVFSSGKL